MTVKNADLIRAVLDGAQGQVFRAGEFIDYGVAETFIRHCLDNRSGLRIKPKPMILVNGIAVPKHETVAPNNGTQFYVIEPTAVANYSTYQWKDFDYIHQWLNKGIVYLSAEDAKARSDAMLKWEDV